MRAWHAGLVSVIGLALIILVAACATPLSGNRAPTVTPKPTATAIELGGPCCNPPSPITYSVNAFPEVHGQASNGELWALLFNTLHVKQEIKIVWRIKGTGDLHLIAYGPQGQHLAPVRGLKRTAARAGIGPALSGERTSRFPSRAAGIYTQHAMITLGTCG